MRGKINAMIETDTIWEDAGYDCDHCGGRILRRTDRETDQPDRKCYQCESCSCQWTLNFKPLRVGGKPSCRAAQRERERETEQPDPYSRWLLLGLGAVALFLLARFGGVVVIRAAVPVALAGLAVYAIGRYGRHEGWW
jgi:hypothetical protein